MSRTKAEKAALQRAQAPKMVRAVIPPAPVLTPEQAQEALQHLLAMVDWGEATCSFGMERKFEPGRSCADENGRGFNCSICRALEFLKKIKAISEERLVEPLPNDHRLPGHVHRASYGGNGCRVCDTVALKGVKG